MKSGRPGRIGTNGTGEICARNAYTTRIFRPRDANSEHSSGVQDAGENLEAIDNSPRQAREVRARVHQVYFRLDAQREANRIWESSEAVDIARAKAKFTSTSSTW